MRTPGIIFLEIHCARGDAETGPAVFHRYQGREISGTSQLTDEVLRIRTFLIELPPIGIGKPRAYLPNAAPQIAVQIDCLGGRHSTACSPSSAVRNRVLMYVPSRGGTWRIGWLACTLT